jgi:hypothetical protein
LIYHWKNFINNFQNLEEYDKIIFHTNNSQLGQIQLVDSIGNTQTTVTQQSVMKMNHAQSTQAVGLELSNGRQLYYTNVGSIILKNGTSLTDVTTSADWIPSDSSTFRPIARFTPVSADTWFVFNPSVNELVKFRINPTTYKVTIVGSKVLTNLVNNKDITNLAARARGAYVTGSNNQFIVVIQAATNESPHFKVHVGQNSLVGA